MSIIALFPFVALLAQQQVSSSSSLDFEYFKTRVQSILLAKREGHARCVSCHTTGTPMRFQPLSPGAAMWNEEESRKNFEVIRARVVAKSVEEQTPYPSARGRGRRGSQPRR